MMRHLIDIEHHAAHEDSFSRGWVEESYGIYYQDPWCYERVIFVDGIIQAMDLILSWGGRTASEVVTATMGFGHIDAMTALRWLASKSEASS